MSGPPWLLRILAAVMLVIAAYCAARLILSFLRKRETELDTDSVHLLMGISMAGMFVPRLNPMWTSAWAGVFAAAAVWFAWQSLRFYRGGSLGGWQCPYPFPHLVESGAMVYALLAASGASHGGGMGMSMSGSPPVAGVRFPVVAAVLALFMLGYVVWVADRLLSPPAVGRARQVTAADAAEASSMPGAAKGGLSMAAAHSVPGAAAHSVPGAGIQGEAAAAAGAAQATLTRAPAAVRVTRQAILAPRLAQGYKVAMGIAMAYMLITML